MQFSELMQSVHGEGGNFTAVIPDSWLQGRTVFGGLQAALAVKAMRALVPAEVPLRTLQTTFIAPVPGGEISLRARVLRSGRSATQVEAWLYDGEQPACLNVAVFGATRPSAIVRARQSRALPSEGGAELPYIQGVTPQFTQHFQFRWRSGGFPFSGAAEPRTCVEVKFREPETVGESQLIAIADSIPTPGLSVLKRPAMASSLTWTLEILEHEYDTRADGAWLLDAEIVAGRDGYLSHDATVWSPDGRAVALSRQCVVVFA